MASTYGSPRRQNPKEHHLTAVETSHLTSRIVVEVKAGSFFVCNNVELCYVLIYDELELISVRQ
jgi:hypothetical protein